MLEGMSDEIEHVMDMFLPNKRVAYDEDECEANTDMATSAFDDWDPEAPTTAQCASTPMEQATIFYFWISEYLLAPMTEVVEVKNVDYVYTKFPCGSI